MSLLRVVWISLLLSRVAAGGIDWKSVWLEPRTPVVLTVGEVKPYTVKGLNGVDTEADLTKSPHLKITSSDAGILEIDRETGTFVAKKPGHVDIQISFGDAIDRVPAFVRPSKTQTAAAAGASSKNFDGVWRAVFTGDRRNQPKMISEIVFALDSSKDALSGVVHASVWPGDAPVSDGQVEGARVRFTMTGRLPSSTNGVAAYPKLCFIGVRSGSEMKIDLLWTEASSSCETGKPLTMAGKKLSD